MAVMDPVAGLHIRLQALYKQVRCPTYRQLARHADQCGLSLPIATVGDLLNGRGTPRWMTVEAFVRACGRYATARRIPVPADMLEIDQWHNDYRVMENELATSHANQTGGPAMGKNRSARRVIPAQLPPDVAGFTGRSASLADLGRLLAKIGEPDGANFGGNAMVIAAINGTAGVGKTALAVHWAHQVAHRFPDGQLYVDLRGFSPGRQVMTPTEAVRRFLDAVDVPPQQIPVDLDAQTALYRSLLARRRMLIMLDNVRDLAQVRPLLPAAQGCLVLVTSRNQLTDLVAVYGAYLLSLDLLPIVEARELLAHRLGIQRLAAEPDAAEEIITRCARLPLALALVAAHGAARPRVALHVLAGELADARQRWHTLTGDDPHTDVRAVFSWSYDALTPTAARLFRLLALHPGPDISAPAAASLTGLTLDAIRPVLAELTRASLLTEPITGRYTFHDLLRDYAAQLAHSHDTDEKRHTAMSRTLDHYLHTASAAEKLLSPLGRDPIPLTPPRSGVTPEQIDDQTQAWDWFTAEHQVLMAAVALATATGCDTHTWQLAWTLATFLNRRGIGTTR